MFKKKTCKKCGEKISDKFNFCPKCGAYLAGKEEDWGMLGKDDSLPEQDPLANSLFGGISGKMLNKMLGSAMKMLEKELKEEMKTPRTNFELYVNGKRIAPENIKVTKKPLQKPVKEPVKKKFHPNIFSQETLKKFSDLPKQEPETNVRRLSNKVIYEVDIPGVTSIKDILINKLENSIEIKALAKDKAYKKLIPIDLPLRRYKLDGQKLVLELGVKG
jgi:HSP20 family molecular chaperone IbpA